MRARWLTEVVLVLVFLAGASLRFAALDFGLPDRFRPDEQYVVESAARLGDGRGFNPHVANYPAAQIYLVWGTGRAWEVVSNSHSRLPERDAVRRWYLVARTIGAAMGSLTIPLTALLAGMIAAWPDAGRSASPAGLLAAALVAGGFLPVRESHFATTDGPMTFWSMAAWLAISAVLTRGRVRESMAAGACVGVAAATKYPAITLVLPLFVAHLSGAHRVRRIALAGAALALAFLVTSPYVLLDFATTAADLGKVARYMTDGALAPGSLDWLFADALPSALGWPLLGLAVAAFVRALLWGNRLERLLAGWLVVAALPLVSARLVFVRYTLPMIPVAMALVAAAGVRVARLVPGGIVTAWAVVLLALAPALHRAIAFDRVLAQPDTRTLAREWMEEHLPRGTIVYSPAYGRSLIPFALPQPAPGTFVYAPANGPLREGAYVLVAEHPLRQAFAPAPALGDRLRTATALFDLNPFRPAVRAAPRYDPPDAFFVPLDGFDAVERPGPRLRLYRLAGPTPQ